jgi:hypothetical protein
MGLRGCMLQHQRLHLGTVSVSSLLLTCARDSRYILLRHAHSVHRPTESTCRITWQMISSRKRRLGTTLSSAVSTSPSRCCLPLSSPFYVVNLVPISPSHHLTISPSHHLTISPCSLVFYSNSLAFLSPPSAPGCGNCTSPKVY